LRPTTALLVLGAIVDVFAGASDGLNGGALRASNSLYNWGPVDLKFGSEWAHPDARKPLWSLWWVVFTLFWCLLVFGFARSMTSRCAGALANHSCQLEKGAHLGQPLACLGKIASLPSDSCSTTNRLFSHPSMHALLRWHTQDSTFATGLFVYNIPPNSDRIILRQLLM